MTHASIFSRLLIKCIRSMFTPRFFFSLFLLSPSTFITQSSSLQDENSSLAFPPPSYVPFQIYLLRLSKISLSQAAAHPEVGSVGPRIRRDACPVRNIFVIQRELFVPDADEALDELAEEDLLILCGESPNITRIIRYPLANIAKHKSICTISLGKVTHQKYKIATTIFSLPNQEKYSPL